MKFCKFKKNNKLQEKKKKNKSYPRKIEMCTIIMTFNTQSKDY